MQISESSNTIQAVIILRRGGCEIAEPLSQQSAIRKMAELGRQVMEGGDVLCLMRVTIHEQIRQG